jgi:hypothetical protein
MNLLDKIVGYFSPHAGLQRAQARKVLRSYQGAEANRLTNHKKPRNQSADQEMMGPYGADALRAWARALVRDNAYAWNVVDTIVSNVVGDGITAQSTYETPEGEDVEDVNDIRDKTFAEWCEVADINGELTFAEIQILAQREMVEAGEVLIRKISTPNKTYKGITRPVPFALELIEADRISMERDTFATRINKENGNRVIRSTIKASRLLTGSIQNIQTALTRFRTKYLNASTLRKSSTCIARIELDRLAALLGSHQSCLGCVILASTWTTKSKLLPLHLALALRLNPTCLSVALCHRTAKTRQTPAATA